MKLIFTLLLLLIVNLIHAQTIISGNVTDVKGEAIPGANIFLENTYDGTTSNEKGGFEFSTNETGMKNLIVKFIGYKEFRRTIELNGKSLTITSVMKEEVNELQAVTITAGSFGASDESRRTIFKPLDIATTAGATADIAGALNTLPGTQKVGESGRLFVRGGDGNEARTFVDGMMVLDAYNSSAPNTPSRGRFLPFMFKGTSFSTGGYSAEYGQALSSALVLDSRDKAERTRTDFGLLSLGGDVAHAHVWDHASAAGKIQYTNIRPYFNLINQEIDWIKPPVAVQASGTFSHDVGEKGIVKVFGNFNRTNFSLYNHDIDDYAKKQSYDLTNDFRYINAAFRNVLSENWLVRGGLSYNYIKNDAVVSLSSVETDRGLHAKTVFEGSISDQFELKTGVEIIKRDYEQVISSTNSPTFSNQYNEVITAAFAEGDIIASNRFVTRVGGRLEHNNLQHQLSIDPRISLAYNAWGNGTFSLAYGKFRQSPKNDYLKLNSSLAPEKADHYIASYQLVENNRTFRAEVYYKRYHNLIKYAPNTLDFTNDGDGYAKGLEFFWRDNRTFKNTDYWISYSYLDTERDYLDFTTAATPTFASAHNFSAVYKYFFTKLKTQFGATYSFSSGRPYNDPNTDRFNEGKTPAYHDLSVNVAYLPVPQLVIYFSATNLLGSKNIFGYEYSENKNDQGNYNSRAIGQPAPRFLFIGIFLTLTKDKSINQLPTL